MPRKKDDKRKEEIIIAMLSLSAEKGLGAVSMGMIAEKVGIKKPSLYNHFASKEQLIESAYTFLRARAKSGLTDSRFLELKEADAESVLSAAVNKYYSMCRQKDMIAFYKVLYQARCIEPVAAKILVEETDKMINATESLFSALQKVGRLKFADIKSSALSFAMTVHAIIDYGNDRQTAFGEKLGTEEQSSGAKRVCTESLLKDFIKSFCAEHSKGGTI